MQTANATTPAAKPRTPFTLYFTDNGAVLCFEHLGASAKYTGRDISGQPIQQVTDADWKEANRMGFSLRPAGHRRGLEGSESHGILAPMRDLQGGPQVSAPTQAVPTGGANVPLMNRELLPGFMLNLQRDIADLTRQRDLKRALLGQCAELAIVLGLELTAVAPAPRLENGSAASPGGADGAQIRGAV